MTIPVAMIVSVAVFIGTAGARSPAANGTLGVDQAFVIGSGNASPGTEVMFWGAQWWKNNALVNAGVPDRIAPASFKGFAAHLDPVSPLCGPFTTETGNSSDPPAGPLPDQMLVLVTNSVVQSGSTITGTVVGYALVSTDPGYAGNPGHPGTGTVEAYYTCGVL